MNIKLYFQQRSNWSITISGLVIVIVIGIVDYLLGPDLSSLIAYLLPVIFVTRFAGKTAGILTSLASTATWIVTDIMADPDYTFLLVHFWNHLEKLAIFIIIVFILLNLTQLENERRHVLSMLAHDMKNPALVAKGFSQRLLNGKTGPLSDKQKEHVRLINDEITRLERLILDFLEVSKFESNKIALNPGPLDIYKHLKKHADAVREEADKKNIRILLNCNDKDVPLAYGDPLQVGRVIRNLMTNAIYYTDVGGTITIETVVGSNYLTVKVQDTGRGIPKEHIKDIFKPFHRVSDEPEGTGLGLPIVQSIIKAHGGRIGVESTLGKGSTFSFILPKYKESHHG